jgi:hypothetical protein
MGRSPVAMSTCAVSHAVPRLSVRNIPHWTYVFLPKSAFCAIPAQAQAYRMGNFPIWFLSILRGRLVGWNGFDIK